MKLILICCLNFLFIHSVFAQSDVACFEKCNRNSALSNAGRINYYQYPSMNKYDVNYLKIDINAETNSTYLSGSSVIKAKVLATMDSVIIEFRDNMILDSVFINGIRKNFSRGSDFIFIPMLPNLSVGTNFTALFYFRGTASANAVFAGTISSANLNYTATLSESYQAREWFPVKQILTDKIDSADIWITTSSTNKAGSNGTLEGVDVLPNGKSRYRWKSRYPMNYYMPSIAVGNYTEYKNYAKPAAIAPDSILIQHYVSNDPAYLNSVKSNLDKTPAFIEKLSELYGLYPFKNEKYGHCLADIGGGMEHQTMTTTSNFGLSVIGHELGHQWWGDNVTCARWNDIWLNEGFATYTEYLLIEKLPAIFLPTTPSGYMQSLHTNIMSVANGSVYIPDASVYDEGRLFSGRLSYNKGAAIIHTLRFEMQNDNLFFQSLQNFQQQYKNSTATGDNFKAVAEITSGKNLTDFFNQWYYGEGYPTYNITYLKANTDSISLIINQTVSAGTITPLFKGLLELKITAASGDTTILINITSNNQRFNIYSKKIPTGIIVDPNNWIINQTGNITNGGVVPVNIISFKGNSYADCSFSLQFTTAQEIEVATYEIESSIDGIHFFKQATITPKRTRENEYQVSLEEFVSNNIYFRIKILKNDRDFTYSNLLNVASTCKYEISLQLSPNPVHGTLYLSAIWDASENCSVTIINEAGQLIRKENRIFVSGKNNWSYADIHKLAAGNYLIQIKSATGKMLSKKFIKK